MDAVDFNFVSTEGFVEFVFKGDDLTLIRL